MGGAEDDTLALLECPFVAAELEVALDSTGAFRLSKVSKD